MNNWYMIHLIHLSNTKQTSSFSYDISHSMLQSRNDAIDDLLSYHNMYINTSSRDRFAKEGASLRYNTLRRLFYRICWYTMMMDGNINSAVLRHDTVLKFFWNNSNIKDCSLSKQKSFYEQREKILSLKNDNKYMSLEYYITRIKCQWNLPKRLYISKSNKYYYGCYLGNYPKKSCASISTLHRM